MDNKIFYFLLLGAGFGMLLVFQGIVINGIHESFKGYKEIDKNDKSRTRGNILYLLIGQYLEKYKEAHWYKPVATCVKCMSSVWGAATYWPVVIKCFGYHPFEWYVFFADVFALVYINFWLYKKL